jgi:Spy/CpxP family protein refolding chaperone
VNGAGISPATVAWSAATVLVAALSAWLVARNTLRSGRGPSEQEFHEWLHAHLEMTPAQHQTLEPFEERYESERARLRAEITAAGNRLADAIRSPASDDATVDEALRALHEAQGELQRATLRHFFLMRDHLDPDQAEKLLGWTRDSLLHGPPASP